MTGSEGPQEGTGDTLNLGLEPSDSGRGDISPCWRGMTSTGGDSVCIYVWASLGFGCSSLGPFPCHVLMLLEESAMR